MRRLLIRSGAVGDCLVALPVMEFMRADYVEVWLPSPVVSLVQFADQVVPLLSTGIDRAGIGEPMSERLKQRLSGFDEIVSWYGTNRPEFRAEVAGVASRVHFFPALPPPGCGMHVTDFLAAQVGAPSGLKLRLRFENIIRRDSIVIHPFSGGMRKNWPLPAYRELADRLGCAVEWNAGPEEPFEDAVRFDNLRELSRWIAGACAYVGNDSGVTHLAAATGVPTLALFGPASSDVWLPRGDHVRVLKTDDLAALGVNAVLQAVRELVGE